MHKAWALVRSNWLAATSYKLSFLFSFGSLILSVVPIFFISGALQKTMADVIKGQGDQYFAFLVLGLIALNVVSAAVSALPSGLQTATSTGTLEALLATPTSIASLLAGLSGYEVLLSLLRGLVMLVAAGLLGAHVAWPRIGASIPIVVLVVLAHLPIAIVAAAMVLAFRTRGPLPQLVMLASTFLGGVYYPTTVIPGWIESISAFLPLTYGLKALRAVLLEGRSLTAVWRDVSILIGFTVVTLAASAVAFRAALGYARRVGNLAQY
ncbi:MAG TPA: ABC transporter permease [Gemmatimonadaceae bacterium]|jgi:ABC-2 type transport system permease protein|nr:ABC transporter permease [Gemmatimonadaceae bacterium]